MTMNGKKRDQVWRHDAAVGAVSAALQAARAVARDAGAAAAFEGLEKSLRARRSEGFEDDLARFATATAALQLCVEFPPPRALGDEADPRGNAPRYFRLATQALHEAGIGARASRLSGLHEDLRGHLARAYASAGEDWRSIWRREVRRAVAADVLLLADRYLEEQGAGDAVVQLLESELEDPLTANVLAIRLARVRTLRLSGAFDEAASVLRDTQDTAAGARGRIDWERACIDAMRTGSLDALFLLLRRDPAEREPQRQLLLWLWAHAVPSREFRRKLPKASTLARHLSRGHGPLGAAVRAVEVLERAYKSSLPLAARIHAIAAMLDEASSLADVALQLLVLGASARWLLGAKQHDLARAAATRYEALCLSLSEGRTGDLFGLSLKTPSGTTDERDRAALPSAVERELTFARLAFSLLRAATSVWTGSPDKDQRATEYAEILAYHSSILKGPVMKVCQLLSYYGFELPEGAASVLASLQDAATPVAFDTMRRVLEADLGKPLGDVFRRFEERPLAAGSIGQVHAAELLTGEHVVVKVQYPGMPNCIRRDFRVLRLLMPLWRSSLPGWNLDGILDELRERMLEECDYAHEAEVQETFRARLHDIPDVVIPRVFSQYSTKRVLVAERFFGKRFAEFAATGTQSDRNRAGVTIVRYVYRTTLQDHHFNTDMHPGNLLFDRGRVCFLDFGNVRRWPEKEGHGVRWMLEGMVFNRVDVFERGLKTLGMVDPLHPGDVHALHRLVAGHLLMQAVVKDELQRLDKDLLVREIRALGSRADKVRIPPIQIYGFRLYWGMFAVIADLRAEQNWRGLVVSCLAQDTH